MGVYYELKVPCAPKRFDLEFLILKTTKLLVETRSGTWAKHIYSVRLISSCRAPLIIFKKTTRVAAPSPRASLGRRTVCGRTEQRRPQGSKRCETKVRMLWEVFLLLQQRSKHPRGMVIPPKASTSLLVSSSRVPEMDLGNILSLFGCSTDVFKGALCA